MKPKIIILGAGGHGRSVVDILSDQGRFFILGFLDDAFPEKTCVWNIPVLGSIETLWRWRENADHVCVAIGNNEVRESVMRAAEAFDYSLPVIVHCRAFVSKRATIGHGTVIMAGASIGTEAILGKGVIVNSGAVIDHDAVVEDFGHLGINAAMSGKTRLGRSAWMHAGSILSYGAALPERTTLAAGKALMP